MLLMTVATKSPESWLPPRSRSSSDVHFVKAAGKLPVSRLLDKSSSTNLSHNKLSLSGISPKNMFPDNFNLLRDGKSPKKVGIKLDESSFPDMSSVSMRRQLARLGGNPLPLRLL